MRGDLQEGHFYASRCHLPIFPSTKSGFLCAFRLRNPHFRAFRAQNRGFCAFLAFATLVFGYLEHKIEVFVRFWGLEPLFSGFSSTKSGFLCALPVAYLPQRPLPATNLIRRRSTPVWLALWHIWAGCGCRLAGAQLQDGKWCFPTALRGRTCRCAGETAAAPETASRKRMLQRWRPRHGRGCRSEEVAAKGAPSGR